MTFPAHLYLGGCLLCLAAGCQTFHPESLSSMDAGASFQARTLDDAELRAFLETGLSTNFAAWPLKTWGLPALTLAAYYYHPSLDVARAQWAVSGGAVRTAGARPNPTVAISPEYNFSAAKGVSPWLAGLSFDLPLETAGKRGYRSAQAKYLSEAARLNIGAVAWQVRKNLRDSLIDLQAAEKGTALLQNELALQNRIVEVLELQVKAGAVTPLETSSAHLASHKIQLDLGAAQSLAADARSRVAEALGLPLSALDGMATSFPAFSDPTGEFSSLEARRRALQNRSDILGSLAEYEASQSALQLEIAKQYPDIHLGTGYQYDQGDNKWSLVGLSLELPLLNRNQGGIAEARARREETAARFAALQAKVIAEMDRALAMLRVAEEQVKASAALLETQQKRQQAVEAQYKAGAVERLEVFSAEVELIAIRLLQIEAQAKAERALSDLEFAAQYPLAPSLQTMLTQTNPRIAKERNP